VGTLTWTPGAVVLFVTAGLSLVVGGLIWRRRSLPGGVLLSVIFLAVTEWAMVAGFEAASVNWSAKILWSRLEYIGSGAAAALYIMFVLQYSRIGRPLPRWLIALIWIVPVFGVVTAATNGLHQLLWRDFLPGPEGTTSIIYVHGPAFYIISGAYLLYLIVAIGALIRTIVHRSLIHRRQSLALLAATCIPLASIVLYAGGWNPLPTVNLIPTSFVLTGTILFLSIAPFRLFDLVPIARDMLVETMLDAVIVLDPEDRIVDLNPAARALIGVSGSAIGRAVERELPLWEKVKSSHNKEGHTQTELSLMGPPSRRVELHITPLPHRNNRPSGSVLVFRDITERFLAQRELQSVNESLTQHVRRIESLQARLHEQAIRDPLTSLYNRRYLGESLPKELARAERAGCPVAAILFDIDRFKQVNDAAGHKAGDVVLQSLSELLRRATRASDMAYRYGGEEFLVILPQTGLATAAARADELRKEFGTLYIEGIDREIRPTLSAGVAVFPDHGTTVDDLVRSADEALYRAKEAGRNRVVCAFESVGFRSEET